MARTNNNEERLRRRLDNALASPKPNLDVPVLRDGRWVFLPGTHILDGAAEAMAMAQRKNVTLVIRHNERILTITPSTTVAEALAQCVNRIAAK